MNDHWGCSERVFVLSDRHDAIANVILGEPSFGKVSERNQGLLTLGSGSVNWESKCVKLKQPYNHVLEVLTVTIANPEIAKVHSEIPVYVGGDYLVWSLRSLSGLRDEATWLTLPTDGDWPTERSWNDWRPSRCLTANGRIRTLTATHRPWVAAGGWTLWPRLPRGGRKNARGDASGCLP